MPLFIIHHYRQPELWHLW